MMRSVSWFRVMAAVCTFCILLIAGCVSYLWPAEVKAGEGYLRFTPGNIFVSGEGDGKIVELDGKTHAFVRLVATIDANGGLRSLSFRDSDTIGAAYIHTIVSVFLINPAGGTVKNIGDVGVANGFAFDAKNQIYVSTAGRGGAAQYDEKGIFVRRIAVESNNSYAIAIRPSDKHVWVGDYDGTIYDYNPENNTTSKAFAIPVPNGLRALLFNPVSGNLYAGNLGRGGQAIEEYTVSGELVRTFYGPEEDVLYHHLTLSPDGTELLGGSYFHNTIDRYRTVDGSYIGSFDAQVVKPTGVAFAPAAPATKK